VTRPYSETFKLYPEDEDADTDERNEK